MKADEITQELLRLENRMEAAMTMYGVKYPFSNAILVMTRRGITIDVSVSTWSAKTQFHTLFSAAIQEAHKLVDRMQAERHPDALARTLGLVEEAAE